MLVDQALKMVQLKPDQINHVVWILKWNKLQLQIKILVGGSTRLPEIQQRLENKFGKSKLKFDINPEKVVAFGAALAANIPKVPSKHLWEKFPKIFPWG